MKMQKAENEDDMEELEKEEGFLHYERVRKALASR